MNDHWVYYLQNPAYKLSTILNCKLDFKFTETVNQVSLKIGAGILENAVYFKFKRE